MHRRLLITICLVAACGGGPRVSGTLGLPTQARVATNVFIIDAALDGHSGGTLVADTGSPFTIADPHAFPGLTFTQGRAAQVDLTVGTVTIEGASVVEASLFGEGSPISGLLGGDVMRDLPVAFNYRDQSIQLGEGASPAGIEDPGASIAFSLEGGGTVAVGYDLAYPATRIPVTVTFEGTAHPFVLDTGASAPAIRTAVFDQLTSDGRTVLQGADVTTPAGLKTAMITRAHDLAIGDAHVSGAAVITIGDDLCDATAMEVGHPVDGVLGGTFLREFFVTIDYPRGEVKLQRWADRGFIVDEYKRAGLSLGPPSQHGYLVSAVYAGSDAAKKGLAMGDEVIAVDGVAFIGLDSFAADALLVGTPGNSHTLGLGTTARSDLANQTIAVLVEDLIP